MFNQDLRQIIDSNLDKEEYVGSFKTIWESVDHKKREEEVNGKSGHNKGFRKKLKYALLVAAILTIGSGSILTAQALRHDDITYSFETDQDLLGEWRVVDFVGDESEFVPGQRPYEHDLYLRGMVAGENGQLNVMFQEETGKLASNKVANTWTKGHIIGYRDKVNSKYTIKQINGKEYLFFEWKSGDYTYRILDHVPLYVLERGSVGR